MGPPLTQKKSPSIEGLRGVPGIGQFDLHTSDLGTILEIITSEGFITSFNGVFLVKPVTTSLPDASPALRMTVSPP